MYKNYYVLRDSNLCFIDDTYSTLQGAKNYFRRVMNGDLIEAATIDAVQPDGTIIPVSYINGASNRYQTWSDF